MDVIFAVRRGRIGIDCRNERVKMRRHVRSTYLLIVYRLGLAREVRLSVVTEDEAVYQIFQSEDMQDSLGML